SKPSVSAKVSCSRHSRYTRCSAARWPYGCSPGQGSATSNSYNRSKFMRGSLRCGARAWDEFLSPAAEAEILRVVGVVGTRPPRPPPPTTAALRSLDLLERGGFGRLDDGFGVREDPLDVVGSVVGLVLHRRARQLDGLEGPVDHRRLVMGAILRASPRL